MHAVVSDAAGQIEQAQKTQCAVENSARARLAKAKAALDQWRESHPPARSPDADTPAPAESAEAAAQRAALEKDVAAAAIPAGIPPAQFNQVQADLRLALAKDRPDDARRLIAAFGNSTPPPLARQTDALLADLRIYTERGGAPFLTGIRAGQ